MTDDFKPTKVRIGTKADGSPHYFYDFTGHPGMAAAEGDFLGHLANTHVIVGTPIPLQGIVTVADGTRYDLADECFAVPLEHVDELALKTHETLLATGLVEGEPMPELGPLAAAKAAWDAAVAGAPPATA